MSWRPWPADKVERRSVGELIPYLRNARTHPSEQIGQVAASIREFGFTNPVLVDEAHGIIAGHARVLAAQKLGLVDAPVRSQQAGQRRSGSTQKPVKCMKRPIENNSSPCQAVYDPFVGCGTTIIAAEMTGRACHAIEIHPAYVDVAVTRWQNFTGLEATRESTSKTFAETKQDRCGGSSYGTPSKQESNQNQRC